MHVREAPGRKVSTCVSGRGDKADSLASQPPRISHAWIWPWFWHSQELIFFKSGYVLFTVISKLQFRQNFKLVNFNLPIMNVMYCPHHTCFGFSVGTPRLVVLVFTFWEQPECVCILHAGDFTDSNPKVLRLLKLNCSMVEGRVLVRGGGGLEDGQGCVWNSSNTGKHIAEM